MSAQPSINEQTVPPISLPSYQDRAAVAPFDCLGACEAFPTCAELCLAPDAGLPVGNLLGTVLLVFLSAMFSGLTLGLMSLSLEGLDILITAGDDTEKAWAKRIYPMRKTGNLLLCTLLLGNTLVNAMIAILSASMTSGLVGGLLSTGIIVIFGEIIPQSICNRHGLRIGAASVVVVQPIMMMLLPITWPIARVLDFVLGAELGTQYNKKQLEGLLEMQMADPGAGLTADDQRILVSALTFSEKQVSGIMTPLDDIFMISITDVLHFDRLKEIYQSGYTRIPVYQERRDRIVGVVFAKDLVLVDPNDEIPVASILPFCSRALHHVPHDTFLERLMQEMQSSRSHLFFVSESLSMGRNVAQVTGLAGIVTMEDVIEELISDEIVDESDTVQDNITRTSVREGRSGARIEFFEMLQRKELLQLSRLHATQRNRAQRNLSKKNLLGLAGGPAGKTTEETRALCSFLSSNVPLFRPASISTAQLRRLVQRCALVSVSADEVRAGRYVYVRGVPTSSCTLLLQGKLQIRAGAEGFLSEVGQWTTLGLSALTDISYRPDFSARLIEPARVLVIRREDWQAVQFGAGERERGGLERAYEGEGRYSNRYASDSVRSLSYEERDAMPGMRDRGGSDGFTSEDNDPVYGGSPGNSPRARPRHGSRRGSAPPSLMVDMDERHSH